MASFSPPVLSSWRALARVARQAATAAGLTALFAAVDASTGTPAAALPTAALPTAASATSSAATVAMTAARPAKARRKASAAKRSKAGKTSSKHSSRTARRSTRRTTRRSTRESTQHVASAPALDLPEVELPDLAVATPSASWEAALAGTPSPAAPAQAAGPLAALSRSATSLLDGLVARARSQLGTRYVYGGAAPGTGLDCSSFVRYVMEALDVRLPRTANQQARVGRPVPRDASQLRPGDLLTFGRGRHTSHVGIYLGEGRFIHASVKSGQVIETTIERNRSLFRRWQGARRLLAGADTVTGDASSGG